MKKWLFSLFCLCCFSLQASIYESNSGYILGYQRLVYDHFDLNLSCPDWQPRLYYYGITPSSTGFFYVNSWDGQVGIYGSNRYIEEENLVSFCQQLQPFETYLLPYATPNANHILACHILSEEETTVSGIPAKKIVFELQLPKEKDEIVTSYIFCKAHKGLFSDYVLGYTYSLSCYKSRYEEETAKIDKAVAKLRID